MASPLADKLRPRTLEDVVGQSHLLAPGQVLRSIICLLYTSTLVVSFSGRVMITLMIWESLVPRLPSLL